MGKSDLYAVRSRGRGGSKATTTRRRKDGSETNHRTLGLSRVFRPGERGWIVSGRHMAESHGGELPNTSEGYEGFQVYDFHHAKVGKVADAFADGGGQARYIGLKTGFFGSKSVLIPAEAVRVNEERGLLQVGMDKDDILAGPTYDNPDHVSPSLEKKVLAFYGVDLLDAGADDLGPDVLDHEDGSRGHAGREGAGRERRPREEFETSGERRKAPPEIRVKRDGHERSGVREEELSPDGGSMASEADGGRERVRIHRLKR